MDVIALEGNGIRPSHLGSGYSEDGKMFTLNTIERHAVVYDARGNGDGDVCPTITGDHENRITDYTALAVSIGNGQLNQMSMEPVANALDCMHDQQAVLTNGKPPRKYIVRRLTPMECGRLQGFPDWWTDGVPGSDSNVYKMWGNGIALPCAADVIGRLAKELEGDNNGQD